MVRNCIRNPLNTYKGRCGFSEFDDLDFSEVFFWKNNYKENIDYNESTVLPNLGSEAGEMGQWWVGGPNERVKLQIANNSRCRN